MDSARDEARLASRQYRWLSATVLVAGITLSALAFFVVQDNERKDLEAAFNRAATDHSIAVRQGFERSVEVVQSLGALYAASDNVTREQFSAFAQHLLTIFSGIQALEWIPRVTAETRTAHENAGKEAFPLYQITERKAQGQMVRAASRPEYFPVYYVKPYAGNEIALGFDLGSNPARLAALNQSRDTGDITATAKITLVQEKASQSGFLIFLPIYRARVLLDTVQRRRENLLGFVLGVFRVGDVVEKALSYHTPGGIDSRLYDNSAPQGERFLYSHLSRTQEQRTGPDSLETSSGHELLKISTFDIAGRHYTLLLAPTRGRFLTHPSWTAWGILASALMLTALLVLHLQIARKRALEQIATNEVLREREARLEKAETVAHLGHWDWNIPQDKIAWSDQVYRIFGLAPQEFTGSYEAFLNLVHAEDREQVSLAMTSALQNHEPYNIDHRIVLPEGTLRFVNEQGQVEFDHSGKPLRMFGIVQDITERTQSEFRLAMEHGVTRLLAESQTVSDAMPKIIQTICETLGWECGARWTWDQQDRLLRCAETWTIASPEVVEFAAVCRQSTYSPSTAGLIRRTWVTREPTWIADAAREAGFQRAPLAAKAGLHGAFAFPILAGSQTLGVMDFFSYEIREPDEVLLRTVRAMGSQIGQFIKRKQAEEALGASEVRYRTLVQNAPVCIHEIDLNGHLISMNQAGIRMMGVDDEARICGVPYLDVVAPENRERIGALLARAVAGETLEFEFAAITDQGIRHFTSFFVPLRDSDGSVRSLMGITQDITGRKRTEETLRLTSRAVESSANGIMITDCSVTDNPITYVNAAFERITGYAAHEVMGRNARFLVCEDRDQMGLEDIRTALHEQREGHAVLRNFRKDGSLFWNDLYIAPVRDETGAVTHFVGIMNDISEARSYQEQLEHQANYDTLTGLANRNLLQDRLRQALRNAHRHNHGVAIAFVDLDNFKFINDTLGHGAGDELLKIVAERLRSCLRESDTVARLGGDEFVLILPGQLHVKMISRVVQRVADSISADPRVVEMLQRILGTVSQPTVLVGRELTTTCSIGVSLYPQDGQDAETLLKNADAAMYRAKELGRNNFQFYTTEINAKVTERLSLEGSLRRALEQEQFVLFYQPKIDLESGSLSGVEALIRWNSPDMGLVPPARFIPILEETGLIIEVGKWVLRKAASTYQEWLTEALQPLRIAVNVSALQLKQKNFVKHVEEAVREAGNSFSGLDLEITESLIMEDIEENIPKLKAVKEMGLGIAIDDFGTGYSSLSYLAKLPVDTLKIDRAFIINIASHSDDLALVSTIISLAHSLKLKVIAEGVETEEQARLLKLLKCDEMQGYLLSPPIPAERFKDWRKQYLAGQIQLGNSG